jgi:GcrA cell cycle regulator
MQNEGTWTDERVSRLKELWSQGKTASEIGVALGGISRNAVIGKVHRLKLSGRPSPIKHRPIEQAPPSPTIGGGTATILALGDRSCKWPMGDPLAADFHFCGKSAAPGIPYCADHSQLAYQPKKLKGGNA